MSSYLIGGQRREKNAITTWNRLCACSTLLIPFPAKCPADGETKTKTKNTMSRWFLCWHKNAAHGMPAAATITPMINGYETSALCTTINKTYFSDDDEKDFCRQPVKMRENKLRYAAKKKTSHCNSQQIAVLK